MFRGLSAFLEMCGRYGTDLKSVLVSCLSVCLTVCARSVGGGAERVVQVKKQQGEKGRDRTEIFRFVC